MGMFDLSKLGLGAVGGLGAHTATEASGAARSAWSPLGLLDAPRRAVAGGIMSGDGGSWLPAAAGAGAALGSLLVPGAGWLAPYVGSGVAGLGQTIMEQMGLTRPVDTEEVTGSDNPFVNFAAGMAMDPLTLAGGAAGLGRGAGTAAEGRLAKYAVADAAGVANQSKDLANGMGRAVSFTPMANPADKALRTAALLEGEAAGASKAGAMNLRPPTPSPKSAGSALNGYEPEQLAGMFGGPHPASDFARATGEAGGKAYAKVNEDVGPLMKYLGMMNDEQQLAGKLPSWASNRGGRLMGAPGAENTVAHLRDLAGMGGEFNHEARVRMMQRLRLLEGLG